MKPIEHRIVLKNDISELERLHDFIKQIGKENHIKDGLLDEINLAVEEAIVNVIDYAYPDGVEGEAVINVNEENGFIKFVIKDKGKPFDPTQVKEADTTLGVEDREIGGLGIFLVRKIMDNVQYERTADGQNVLTLIKKIKEENI